MGPRGSPVIRHTLQVATGTLVGVIVAAGGWVLGLDRAQQQRSVPVLMYHNITEEAGDDVWAVEAEEFERHLIWLRKQGYRSIRPSDLVQAARRCRWLPRRPVIITFDDGLENVLRLAEPLLKKYGFTATAYVITGLVAGAGENRRLYRNDPVMTWAEIAAMDRRGVIRVGSHSHTHSRFPNIVATEAAKSRRLLREHTGAEIRDFCYPYGAHPPALVEAVRVAGFRTAMICEDRVAVFSRKMDLLRIPRISVYGGRHRFVVERVPPLPEEGDAIVFSGRNDGLPVPILPVLVIQDRRFPLADPIERLGPEPQRWRWPRAMVDEAGATTMRLELWDRHQVLRLYP